VPREGFWLVVSALEPYKRVELAVEAASRAGARLVVVGEGSCRAGLAARAGPGVEWPGRVSLERLRDLYRRARALLYPQVEDFGISAVEAQACGLPVVARGAGGALDTVIDGRTGVLCPGEDAEALLAGVRRCPDPSDPGVASACRDNALRFAEDRFDERIEGAMRRALAGGLTPSGPTNVG
jgi:glycosyltransferase involved in cell wall biosynthesis